MKVLVACEYSGVVRDAFINAGHWAVSCDLLPTESPLGAWRDGFCIHHQGDVFDYLDQCYADGAWFDLIIAHPDCTYLTCSAEWAYTDGPYHQKVKPGTLVGAPRRDAREHALGFVRKLLALPIKRKCIENPRGVIGSRIRPATQYIQPHQYGEDASKITGLWLENLPLLVPTRNVPGRLVEWPRGSGRMVERWANQTDSGQNRLTPGPNRWKERAKTYSGWADAMANQWAQKESQVFSGVRHEQIETVLPASGVALHCDRRIPRDA